MQLLGLGNLGFDEGNVTSSCFLVSGVLVKASGLGLVALTQKLKFSLFPVVAEVEESAIALSAFLLTNSISLSRRA
ncbi:hypothetical protein FD724_06785 [Nostoc sp. C057]|uniref:hypothetical protein n=1 Tax=Nostoc sp. C057 TaxID=2576903 RepID=UPI0015C3F922|nr:hypothetical protein [Nostoc sp. C057]QLE47844.1 hypothetical protein FD724_06785 [Nostoc sp. C057]